MGDTLQTNVDTQLGRLVIEQGLATSEEVQDCLNLLRETSAGEANNRSLADILVSNGVVTKKQLDRIRPGSEEDKSFQTQQIPGFTVMGKLGAGAMATVYKARQLSLDRIVAIKVLPKKYTNNPEFVSRFYAEGKAAAKLNHPNIVGALDVGRIGDTHYFVMEYVEGKTVYDDIADGKRYSEERSLDIIIQVAKALEHAHKAGFIHRDVKPKNIMITKAGVVKLADMGLARAVSDKEAAEAEAGKAYGTPYYISPEQIRGEKDVDVRADIYSLGATFYHMVTGQVPFDGPNPSAVMHKHLKSELTPPDQINTSLSAGVGEIIEVCMAKDRDKRYKSTTEVLQDLLAVQRHEPPLQARKKFDLASLATLEKTGEVAAPSHETMITESPDGPKPLTETPLFWIAVAGWGVAVVFVVIIVMLMNAPHR